MSATTHDPKCRAVNFCGDTGRYTGTCAFDPANCAQCRTEQVRAEMELVLPAMAKRYAS